MRATTVLADLTPGHDAAAWQFRCPGCGITQSATDQTINTGPVCCINCGLRYRVMHKMPTATLANGRTVGNFSSTHDFKFDDGTVLPRCEWSRKNALAALTRKETRKDPAYPDSENIDMSRYLSPSVIEEIRRAETTVDILLVPLPILDGIHNMGMDPGRCRSIIYVDRETHLISATQFCTKGA